MSSKLTCELLFPFAGGSSVKICGIVQYLNLFGSAIGYNIAAAMSLM
jgi:hypothetical protein